MNQEIFKRELVAKFSALASSSSPDFSEIARLMADSEIEAYIASDAFIDYLAGLARPGFCNPILIKCFIESSVILQVILNAKKRRDTYSDHWERTAGQRDAIIADYQTQLDSMPRLERSVKELRDGAKGSVNSLRANIAAKEISIQRSRVWIEGRNEIGYDTSSELPCELGYSTASAYSAPTSSTVHIPGYYQDGGRTAALRGELTTLSAQFSETLRNFNRYSKEHNEISSCRETIEELITEWRRVSNLLDKGEASRRILALIPLLETASVALDLVVSKYSAAAAPGETASASAVRDNQTLLLQGILTLIAPEVSAGEVNEEKKALLKSWLIRLVQKQIDRRTLEPDSISLFGFRFSFSKAQKVEALANLRAVIQSTEARRMEAIRALTNPALRQGRSTQLYALALSVFSQIEEPVPSASAVPVAT